MPFPLKNINYFFCLSFLYLLWVDESYSFIYRLHVGQVPVSQDESLSEEENVEKSFFGLEVPHFGQVISLLPSSIFCSNSNLLPHFTHLYS